MDDVDSADGSQWGLVRGAYVRVQPIVGITEQFLIGRPIRAPCARHGAIVPHRHFSKT